MHKNLIVLFVCRQMDFSRDLLKSISIKYMRKKSSLHTPAVLLYAKTFSFANYNNKMYELFKICTHFYSLIPFKKFSGPRSCDGFFIIKRIINF